jgi:hypothetical protein
VWGRANGARFGFKKGGAACIRFEKQVEPGRGVLMWMVSPRLLLDHAR